ncbi:MAG TPA: amino acid ABC transporter permease [Stellaceae bacterium]|nr:amino acid ABC transporter permease [Stellaceae bacterium]
MDVAVIWNNLPYLAMGLAVTLQTAALVIVAGSVFGLALGLLRSVGPRPLRVAAMLYIEFIRGTPLLVVLFIIYFAVPALIGFRFTAYTAAVIGFVAFIGAYIAEDCRSGLASVPKGQAEAGLASGLTRGQVMRLIILPQAIRRMLPALFGQFVRLVKFTSVASVIGVTELTGAALTVNAREFRPLEIIIFLGFAYFVLCLLLSQLGRWLNRRYAIPQ